MVKALVDSGAGRSIISSKFFEQLRQAGVGFHFSKNVMSIFLMSMREDLRALAQSRQRCSFSASSHMNPCVVRTFSSR